ncbi:MAG: hypothetical protein ACM34K_10560 [Bacillota bacterium]
MKKILLLLSIIYFLFSGCDKIPSGIVDNQQPDFQAVEINTPSRFVYTTKDSIFVSKVRFTPTEDVKSVWFDILKQDGSKLNSSPIYMYDDGNIANGDSINNDKVYSGIIPLGINYNSGRFRLEYFVADNNNAIHNVAVHQLRFINSVRNHAPRLISIEAPDSLDVNVAGQFTFQLKVEDQDGQDDINSVYFQSYRPDGSTTGETFKMYDDGKTFSDKTAGDGIFTYSNTLPASARKGAWTFIFQAIDESDSLSNSITHKIIVK